MDAVYRTVSKSGAIEAQQSGFLAGEICAVKNEDVFEIREARSAPGSGFLGSRAPPAIVCASARHHPSANTGGFALAGVRGDPDRRQQHPRVVDGAAGVLCRRRATLPQAAEGTADRAHPRLRGRRACRRRSSGIGPVAAIRALLAATGLKLPDIDRIEINEAFGCQSARLRA